MAAAASRIDSRLSGGHALKRGRSSLVTFARPTEVGGATRPRARRLRWAWGDLRVLLSQRSRVAHHVSQTIETPATHRTEARSRCRRVERRRHIRLLAASRQQSKNYIGTRPQQTTASPFNEHEKPAHGRVSRHLPWGSSPLGEISAVIVTAVCLTATIRSRSSSLPQRFHPTSTL